MHASLRVLLAFFAAAVSARANSLYDESLSGDLSNLGSAPTQLVFSPGVNRIIGTMGGGSDADPDIFTFTIQPGQSLSSIYLGPMNPQERSFYAIASGSTINMTDATTHLGSYLTYTIGELIDILAIGGAYGGTGFELPLGPGTYTAWFQEVSTRVDYEFAYTVIPEPATTALILSGTVILFAFISRYINTIHPVTQTSQESHATAKRHG